MYRGTTKLGIKTAGNTRTVYGDLTPLKSEEYTDGMQQVVSRYRVHLPVSAGSVVSTDEIVLDGISYGVKGDAEPHRLLGRLHHYEAIVERVTG